MLEAAGVIFGGRCKRAAHRVRAVAVLALGVAVCPFATAAEDLRGLVRAKNQAVISSEVNARITAMPFDEGEPFEQGQILVEFDCSLYRAELQATRAALAAQRKRHQNNLELAKYDAVGSVEVDITAAEARKAGADVNAAATRAERCKIVAPFDGRVVERRAQPHESVAQDQELIHIVDSSALIIELIAPSDWLTWLEPGETFNFAVDETRKVHEAEVERIGAVVDAVSHTVKIYGRFSGDDARVLAGMSGTARFSADRRAQIDGDHGS